jgi:aryl-alcohol dehydrogenase-like predicted oxidoreductase
MDYRILGKTGLKVSEIGYGAWGIGKSGWIGASDDESIKALRRSIDLGLNFIDTALGYGEGHSERLVGRLIKERSERIYVATKIPLENEIWPAVVDAVQVIYNIFEQSPEDRLFPACERHNVGVICIG